MSVQVSYKKQTLFGLIILICIFGVFELGSRFYEFFIQDCGLENAETLSEYNYFLKRYICYDQQIIEYVNQPVLTMIPNQHFTTVNINNDGSSIVWGVKANVLIQDAGVARPGGIPGRVTVYKTVT